MTTYPLSEPATMYRSAPNDIGDDMVDDVVARAALSDCVDVLKEWSPQDRATVYIQIDNLDLRYGPEEIEELLAFLRQEAESVRPNETANRPFDSGD